MRYFIIFLLCMSVCMPCLAKEQIWVKNDVQLGKKPVPAIFEVTEKMKTDTLNLSPHITIPEVKKIIQGTSDEARQVIDILIKEKKIETYEERYNDLYPSSVPHELEP